MSIEQWSELMFPEREGTVSPVYGNVKAVNADGSYMVQLNASGVLTRCAPCCTAVVGDRVLVLIKPNGKCDAIGRLGGEIGGGGAVTVQHDDASNWIAGRVFAYAGVDEPIGCLPCDGRAVSRTVYWELFNAIGTTYGAGDGSSTFNLPNIQSRTVIGESDTYTFGSTGGEEKHTMTVDEIAGHEHWMPVYDDDASTTTIPEWTIYAAERWTSTGMFKSVGSTGISGNRGSTGFGNTWNAGGSQPHNNMQPYIVMRYFITTGKGDPASGINPADYVAEWGTTGEWNWRKYASGKAECWISKVFEDSSGFSAWGTGYVSNQKLDTRDYPFEFLDYPRITPSYGLVDDDFSIAPLVTGGSKTKSPIVQGYRPSSLDGGKTYIYQACVHAEGFVKTPSASGGTESIAPTIESRFAELEARLAEAEYDTGWKNFYVIDNKIEVKARRVGKMVTVVGASWGYITLPANGWHSITTLDSRFRPSIDIPFNINAMGSYDYEICNSSQIQPDGLVRAYVSKETSYWKFSVSYPVG